MVLRRRKKEKPREAREPRPPKAERLPAPAPTAGTLAGLTGTVRTFRPGTSTPYAIPWSNVARWASAFTNAGAEFGVDPLLMAAMAVVESDANHEWPNRPGVVITRDDGLGDGPSVGLMQVKPRFWKDLVPGADIMDPVGNIRIATKLMANAIRQHGTWEKALTRVYFPMDDKNGTTQDAYVATVRSLMAEMRNQLKPVDPPQATPAPQDPIAVIVGGAYPPITYGWRADAGLNYYAYGVGHGTTRATQHTGVDVGVPDETPLYSPVAGRVLCVGEAGQNTWGQSCGAYRDTMGGGVGNITILGDSGHKITLGHCSSATVGVGERVAAGQRVGRSGGMNGPHVHVEVAVERNGTYWLVDPIPALREAMRGTPVPTPLDTVPFNRDAPNRNLYIVSPTWGGTTAYQRADRQSKALYDIPHGTTVEAVESIVGNDGKEWWLLANLARVPREDTTFTTRVG